MNIPESITVNGVTMLVKYEGRQATPGEISAYMLDLKSAKEELAVMEGYLAKHQARARRVEEETAEVMVRLERARTMITLRTEGFVLVRQYDDAQAIADKTGGVVPGSAAAAGLRAGQISSRLGEAAAGLAARREWLDQEASK